MGFEEGRLEGKEREVSDVGRGFCGVGSKTEVSGLDENFMNWCLGGRVFEVHGAGMCMDGLWFFGSVPVRGGMVSMVMVSIGYDES